MSSDIHYDKNTINFSKILLPKRPKEVFWGKMTPEIFNKILDLHSNGQRLIRNLLNILNDNDLDHVDLFGEQKYRYMIRCSQKRLAEILNMDKGAITRGLKELVDANLIIKEDGIIYLHPFLLNTNKIVDIRTLQKFRVNYEGKKNTVTREKVDPSQQLQTGF